MDLAVDNTVGVVQEVAGMALWWQHGHIKVRLWFVDFMGTLPCKMPTLPTVENHMQVVFSPGAPFMCWLARFGVGIGLGGRTTIFGVSGDLTVDPPSPLPPVFCPGGPPFGVWGVVPLVSFGDCPLTWATCP